MFRYHVTTLDMFSDTLVPSGSYLHAYSLPMPHVLLVHALVLLMSPYLIYSYLAHPTRSWSS